jgi:hypothetical protein
LGDIKGERDAGSSYFLKFLKDAADHKMFGLARTFMWIGLILLVLCSVYFIALLAIELLKKEKLISKLSLPTKIMQFVIVGALLLIIFAGLDNKTIEIGNTAKETLSITLLGFPYAFAFVFGVAPIASEYLIK